MVICFVWLSPICFVVCLCSSLHCFPVSEAGFYTHLLGLDPPKEGWIELVNTYCAKVKEHMHSEEFFFKFSLLSYEFFLSIPLPSSLLFQKRYFYCDVLS